MSILFQHDLPHTCLPGLAAAFHAGPALSYGTVVECETCKQAWMLTPRRLWLRRHIVNQPGYGFWVREPRSFRKARRDAVAEDLIFSIEDMLIKEAWPR